MKVFIVDDYKDYSLTLRDKFEIEGHESEFCLFSTEVVERALNYKPDWVVLDVRMPEKSGAVVYQELNKQADFEFSTVFYSNYTKDPDIQKELKEAGVPDAVIFQKTNDLDRDVKNKLIPSLRSKHLTGGNRGEQ
ncbi:MAG: two-component system response regulator [Candidatus Omnitrophota bacterium]